MKNKRGTHIGVIISYIIFISSIIFLIVVTKPIIKKEGITERTFDFNLVKEKLLKETMINVTEITVYNNSGGTKNCLSVNMQQLNIGNGNITVKNKNGEKVRTNLSGNNLAIEFNPSEKNFFKIYLSKDPNEQSLTANNDCTTANIGLIKQREYTSENKIKLAINEYNFNYKDFKNKLEIPDYLNFDFSFTYQNDTTISTENRNITNNFFVKSFPVEYFNQKADIETGLINIKIW